MIKNWLLTGDCHRDFSRFKYYDEAVKNDEETAVIILGDAGINYCLDDHDTQIKNYLTENYKFYIYCVRGNHEARPQDVPGMELIYDENVKGEVYMEPQWPKIRYFKDWGFYTLGYNEVAVIGGAYSVDKQWRLLQGAHWFDNEQLSSEEMVQCMKDLRGKHVVFVLTHTCPVEWEPNDLFLSAVDQSSVDKTMERFLSLLAKELNWKIWCFGHYHADRIERPYVEQYYKDTENLELLSLRWHDYDETKELEWWLVKSPNFYMGNEILESEEKHLNE